MENYQRYLIIAGAALIGLVTIYAFGVIYYVVIYILGFVSGAVFRQRRKV